MGRSLKAGANEFGTAIKEGASNLKANVNARVNPTPVDNMNLTDKRSIGQKINSAVKQARDNFSYQNFAE
ncbi:MAG: hypothetical protein LBG59_07475 [Candidatus Peribacteria bacterium]|nr:hypothetical protein [Candidatus Peribacteria bacterium]